MLAKFKIQETLFNVGLHTETGTWTVCNDMLKNRFKNGINVKAK